MGVNPTNTIKTPCKIQSVAFLVWRPISELEIERWGIENLKTLNISIVILDLTYLVHGRHVAQEIARSVGKPIIDENICTIKSYSELEKQVKKLSIDTLFIDYIHGVSPITVKTAKIFRILKKYKAKYSFISDGALPVSVQGYTNNLWRLNEISYLLNEAIKNPKKIFNFLTNKLFKTLAKRGLFFPTPCIIFGGNSPVLERFIIDRGLDRKIIVPINSYDFSRYSEYLSGIDNNQATDTRTCVFLDEALIHHSDFAILGIDPPEGESYYKEMNLLFYKLERQTGLRVVIAAHPRSNYEIFSNPFNGREIVKGSTMELVAKSQLVLMHMSTSVSYAILFEKPIMAVKIPGVGQDSLLNGQVKTMASAIGSVVIDTERYSATHLPVPKGINKNKYEEYKQKYLVNNNAERQPTWKILASKMREL